MNEVVSDAWNEAMEDLQKQIADAEKLLVKSHKSDPWKAKSVIEYCKKYKLKEQNVLHLTVNVLIGWLLERQKVCIYILLEHPCI